MDKIKTFTDGWYDIDDSYMNYNDQMFKKYINSYIKDFENTTEKLHSVMNSISNINKEKEVFLQSEIDIINKIIATAIDRTKRGVVGKIEITKEEREKTINDILD